MVGMLVRHDNGVQGSNVLADRFEAPLDLTATQARVEEDTNRIRGNEGCVAFRAATKNAGPQFLSVSPGARSESEHAPQAKAPDPE